MVHHSTEVCSLTRAGETGVDTVVVAAGLAHVTIRVLSALPPLTPGVGVPNSARGTVTLAEVAPHTGLGPEAAACDGVRLGHQAGQTSADWVALGVGGAGGA